MIFIFGLNLVSIYIFSDVELIIVYIGLFYIWFRFIILKLINWDKGRLYLFIWLFLLMMFYLKEY